LATELQIGYDAVSVGTIPDDAELVYWYDIPSTLAAVNARFPDATKIGITTQGAPGFRMCDMETGDLTAPETAQWAYNEVHSGRPIWDKPTPYCQAANCRSVITACADLGLRLGDATDLTCDVWWFQAWWNNVPDLGTPAGWGLPVPVGHQYFRQGQFTYDISVALSSWVWPAPPTPPKPKVQEAELFIRNPKSGEVDFISGGKRFNIGAHGTGWDDVEASASAQNLPVPLVVEDNSGAWFATFPPG
jgi:hypothetical protein